MQHLLLILLLIPAAACSGPERRVGWYVGSARLESRHVSAEGVLTDDLDIDGHGGFVVGVQSVGKGATGSGNAFVKYLPYDWSHESGDRGEDHLLLLGAGRRWYLAEHDGSTTVNPFFEIDALFMPNFQGDEDSTTFGFGLGFGAGVSAWLVDSLSIDASIQYSIGYTYELVTLVPVGLLQAEVSLTWWLGGAVSSETPDSWIPSIEP